MLVSVTAAGHQVVDQATARRRALIEDILRKLPAGTQHAVAEALRAFADAAGEIPRQPVAARSTGHLASGRTSASSRERERTIKYYVREGLLPAAS